MVQLSAAGLGVPTDNVGAGLSSALREGTQGFVMGRQMKLQQEESARKQAMYEQALKEAIWKHGQEQSQAQAQVDAQGLIGQQGHMHAFGEQAVNAEADALKSVPGVGGMLSSVLKMSAGQQGKAMDFSMLQQHHADVTKQAGAIAGKLPPQYVQQFWNDIKSGMQQDAMNLQRTHVADDIHDALMNGQLHPPDPITGERVPNEAITQQFAAMVDKVKSGDMDPLQAEQAYQSTVQKFIDDEAKIKHRTQLADAFTQSLGEAGVPTPFQIGFGSALKIGLADPAEWQKVAPYVQMGLVPDPNGGKGWMLPQDAEAERKSKQAETRQKNASAARSEADAAYISDVKPGIEQGKNEARMAAIDQRAKAQNENLQFRKDKQTQDDQTKRDLAAQKLEAAARKSATESGFSNAKALNEAIGRALQMFKEGLLTEEQFQPKVDELKAQFSTKQDGAKPDAAERARQFLNKPK